MLTQGARKNSTTIFRLPTHKWVTVTFVVCNLPHPYFSPNQKSHSHLDIKTSPEAQWVYIECSRIGESENAIKSFGQCLLKNRYCVKNAINGF